MLEAVDHEEESALGTVFEECRAGRPARVISEAQCVDQGVLQQGGIVDRGQLHQPDPVAVPFLQERRHPGDQPGLADSAHPDDGDEPGLLQQSDDIGQLGVAPHESVQLRGEIARAAGRGSLGGGGRRAGIAGRGGGALRVSHETRRVLARKRSVQSRCGNSHGAGPQCGTRREPRRDRLGDG